MRNGNNKCTLCPSGLFCKNPYTMRSVMIKDFYTNFCGTRKTSSTYTIHITQENTDHRFKQPKLKVNSIDGAIYSSFHNFQMITYFSSRNCIGSPDYLKSPRGPGQGQSKAQVYQG